jgi:hypothetical protein
MFRGRDKRRNERTNEGNMQNDLRNIKTVNAGETQEENVNMNSKSLAWPGQICSFSHTYV